MKCANCQYESEHEFKFCPECGVTGGDESAKRKLGAELVKRIKKLEAEIEELKSAKEKEPKRSVWDEIF